MDAKYNWIATHTIVAHAAMIVMEGIVRTDNAQLQDQAHAQMVL